MIKGIVKTINDEYGQTKNSTDVTHIMAICNLYKFIQRQTTKSDKTDSSNVESDSISLNEIKFTTPKFKKCNIEIIKRQYEKGDTIVKILREPEFLRKYGFFIRILYACLKIDVGLFDVSDNIATLKNNYQLIQAFKIKKRQLINNHIQILKNQYQEISKKLNQNYELFIRSFLMQIKIIDKLFDNINYLLENRILEKNDCLLTLIRPYFFVPDIFIEEYN